MRVLFLTGRAADGGSERFVSSLAAELSARGHECLLVYDEPGLLSEELAAGGTECIRLKGSCGACPDNKREEDRRGARAVSEGVRVRR